MVEIHETCGSHLKLHIVWEMRLTCCSKAGDGGSNLCEAVRCTVAAALTTTPVGDQQRGYMGRMASSRL